MTKRYYQLLTALNLLAHFSRWAWRELLFILLTGPGFVLAVLLGSLIFSAGSANNAISLFVETKATAFQEAPKGMIIVQRCTSEDVVAHRPPLLLEDCKPEAVALPVATKNWLQTIINFYVISALLAAVLRFVFYGLIFLRKQP